MSRDIAILGRVRIDSGPPTWLQPAPEPPEDDTVMVLQPWQLRYYGADR